MSDIVKRLLECDHRAKMHYFNAPIYKEAADEIERLEKERDEAQATVTSWQFVFEGIQAHIKDRMAMNDPAEPATYLEIIEADIAGVIRTSKQIVAARWADRKQQADKIERLEIENAELKERCGLTAIRARGGLGESK